MAAPPSTDRVLPRVLAQLAALGARLRPVIGKTGTALAQGATAAVRGAVRHRAVLGAIGLRALWWSALVLLVVGGRHVLGLASLPSREWVLAPFVVGLVLCAVLRLADAPRRLHVAALGLGAVHGLAVVLVWTAFAG